LVDHGPARLLDLLGIDDELAPRWDCTGGVRDLLDHAEPGTLLKQSKMSPIFIHAWWRSSSTYVWSKLRRDPSLRCYYEPLHERLAVLDRATIEGATEVDISRNLRHPIPEKHYFFEYLDLVASGQLRYSQDLAYARYLLRPEQTDEALRAYLEGLIGAATAAGRTPALCFCRSQMRSAWMKRVFGGFHVAQIRNPFDQWVSFRVDPYFVRRMLTIALGLRSQHPLAFAHIEGFEQLANSLARQAGTQGESGKTLPIGWRDLLGVFLLVWMASALQAIGCCDYLLDVDRLSADENYRQESSRRFGAVGCTVDFTDCSTPATRTSSASAALFEVMVAQSAKAIRSNASTLVIADAAAVAQQLSSLSASSGRILKQALPDR
jgi:hypothetical protein